MYAEYHNAYINHTGLLDPIHFACSENLTSFFFFEHTLVFSKAELTWFNIFSYQWDSKTSIWEKITLDPFVCTSDLFWLQISFQNWRFDLNLRKVQFFWNKAVLALASSSIGLDSARIVDILLPILCFLWGTWSRIVLFY